MNPCQYEPHAPIDLLSHLVESLATARHLADIIQSELEKKLDEFESRPDVKAAREQLVNITLQITDLDKQIRTEAVERYAANGYRQPHAAVKIQMRMGLTYTEDDAMVWCAGHLPAAINAKLDRRFFEKHARAVMGTSPIPCVHVQMEPQAVISGDLSQYIPEFVPEMK